MIIIVTGVPGTGKTKIAIALSKKLKIKYLDVNKFIKLNKLYDRYNNKLDTYEVDIKKLNKFLIKKIKEEKDLVIDSHLSHYLPSKYVDYCIVTKTELKELKKRLKKRKYSEEKIKENLESQIFDVCLIDALENKHNIIEIDTTNKNIKHNISFIISKIK